jgi:hypothetical protein
MSDPCMSCGDNRREPPPERCLHKDNHLPWAEVLVGKTAIEAKSWDAAVAELAAQIESKPRPLSDSCRFEGCHALPGFCANPEG